MLRGLRRLNRTEKRLLDIARRAGELGRLRQIGFSRRTADGFRFPIHCIELGTPKAIRRHPAGLIAGVHGLEFIGVRVVLDFLEAIVEEDFMPELRKGRLGIVCIPLVNPGGIALKRRSNPAGVDLMRNSGVQADHAMPFFGGHRISSHLPYYRGASLEPESRALRKVVIESFFNVKNSLIPVVDVHSGFGSCDHVWWPYAGRKTPCADSALFERIADHMRRGSGHDLYRYGPQSETYTTHGDLWDRFYDEYRHHAGERGLASRFLPITLEIGTWTELRANPARLLNAHKIFNPPRETKAETTIRYRRFLRDLLLLATEKASDAGRIKP